MTVSITGPAPTLTKEQFPAFFEQVHGWAPFPWQQALLHRVLEQGWPALIECPPGSARPQFSMSPCSPAPYTSPMPAAGSSWSLTGG